MTKELKIRLKDHIEKLEFIMQDLNEIRKNLQDQLDNITNADETDLPGILQDQIYCLEDAVDCCEKLIDYVEEVAR